MDLRPLINLNLAVLGVLSATLVGVGEPNGLLPVGMLAVAAASLWYCDHLGRIVLDRWIINAAVLTMAAVAAWRFAQVGGAVDAAVAADGLIGLQAVMFFERKTARTRWDLFSLSLLQVFLSCAFNHGPFFAALLTVYIFFALSALALLALHRENQRCSESVVAYGRSAGRERPRRLDWWRLSGVAVATLIVGPLSLYLRFRPQRGDPEQGPAASSSLPGRPELDRETPAMLGKPWLEAATRGQPPARPAWWDFWWRNGRLTLASLLIGTCVFCMTPRFGGVEFSMLRGQAGGWGNTPTALQRTVGFDDRVELGELGSIIENSQKVLSIRFFRHRRNERYRVQGDIFLRGAVVNQYRDGRWEYRPDGEPIDVPLFEPDREEVPEALTRQEIRLEPLDRAELFCVWPFVYLVRDERVQFDPISQRLMRPGGLRRRRFSYDLATTAFVDGRQADLSPATARVDTQPLLQWPEQSLPRLSALARQWMTEANLPATDLVGRVRVLERGLRHSPRFRYRLGDQQRDSRLDPIEDFIVNDPRGHCEYFASALTLMLRSQGLPARMIVGYKTDEYNYLEERYWARQSHAHTWVEAYLPPESIPEDLRYQDPLFDWSHGGWLRLDPTPSDLDELSLVEYMKQKLRDWQAAVRTAWTQHVVQMSGSRQDSLIYRPLVQAVRQSLGNLSNAQWWWGGQQADFNQVLASPWRLITSPILLIGCGATAFGVLVWLTILRWRTGATGHGRRRSAALRLSPNGRPHGGAEFYRRWESVLGQCGLHRAPCQTPREFACEVGGRLAEAAEQPQLRDAALRVVDAFYEIRYGGATLDDRQTAAIEDALSRFQHAARQTSARVARRQ